VAELVKIISLGLAFIESAKICLLFSKASLASWPNECKDIVLPNSLLEYGSIAFDTLLSTGVVAA
jgi:hypothetical protein